MLFRGSFPYQIDDRGRVPIPPRYRSEFATGALLVQAPENCIQVFTDSAWETEAAVLEQLSPESEDARNALRDFYGNTHEVPKDSQGRIVIPPQLREYAGLDKDVLVVGVKDRLEIWDRQAYEASRQVFADARRTALNRISAEKDRARIVRQQEAAG
jgi:MraZ protein